MELLLFAIHTDSVYISLFSLAIQNLPILIAIAVDIARLDPVRYLKIARCVRLRECAPRLFEDDGGALWCVARAEYGG